MTTYKLPEPAMKTHGAVDPTDKHWFTAAQMQSAYSQGRIDQRTEQEELERLYDSVRVAMNNEHKAR